MTENEATRQVREHLRRRMRVLPWRWPDKFMLATVFIVVVANFVFSLFALLNH